MKINTIILGNGDVIITKDAYRNLHMFSAERLADHSEDSDEGCHSLSENDAHIIFSAQGGVVTYSDPIAPDLHCPTGVKSMLDYKTALSRAGLDVITENADGDLYMLSAEHLSDVIEDWNGDCDYVPANDANVFFAAWNGSVICRYAYKDFESMLDVLKKELLEWDEASSTWQLPSKI